MELLKTVTDEWMEKILNDIKEGRNKLSLLNESIQQKFNPKEIVEILGIFKDAEWIETNKCVLLTKKNFLSEEECKIIRENIKSSSVSSVVIGENNGFRNSKTKFNMNIDWVNQKLHQFMGSDEFNSESTQGTFYEQGGFFKLHGDYFNITSIKENKVWDYQIRGQRTWTALIYLNTLEDGSGKTTFPHLKQSFTPELGRIVFWYNLLPDGTPNKNTEHIAEDVKSEKYVIQKWYREKQYKP